MGFDSEKGGREIISPFDRDLRTLMRTGPLVIQKSKSSHFYLN